MLNNTEIGVDLISGIFAYLPALLDGGVKYDHFRAHDSLINSYNSQRLIRESVQGQPHEFIHGCFELLGRFTFKTASALLVNIHPLDAATRCAAEIAHRERDVAKVDCCPLRQEGLLDNPSTREPRALC